MSQYKVILLGDSQVGKTSLIYRHLYDQFHSHYSSTIGATFYNTKVKYDNITFTISYWDTTTSKTSLDVLSLFYKNAIVALVLYDVNNITSFNNALKTIDYIRNNYDMCHIVLVGHKSDLVYKTSLYDAQLITDHKKVVLMYCSSYKNNGVKELFEYVQNYIINLQKTKLKQDNLNIILLKDELLCNSCCYL